MGKNLPENPLRVRLGKTRKDRMNQMLRDRKITQQQAVLALVDWIVEQDPLVQLVIFGQAPQTQEILQLIVEAWGSRGSPSEQPAGHDGVDAADGTPRQRSLEGLG